MHDKELYEKILGISRPWSVEDVNLRLSEGKVEIRIVNLESSDLCCPDCKVVSSRYDEVKRSWRHLDTCQYETILIAGVPRVNCKEHGVKQVNVPWAEKGSRLTSLFERLVIDWLKEASISAVSKHLGLSWKQVDGVMQRAVKRGLLIRQKQCPVRLGIDETSFQKRHEYVTIITDMDKGHVVNVIDDRKKSPLEEELGKLGKATLSSIQSVSMDMHQPFIQAVKSVVPDAGKKIAFDKFHVIAHLTKAVNQVRRQENLDLLENGVESLKGTRFLWITAQENLTKKQVRSFKEVKDIAVRTSEAWTIKEIARNLWSYTSKREALRAWKSWIQEAMKSELTPIKKAASMVQNHLQGIITAILLKATNAKSEAINNRVQFIKKIAYGFRNRERFKNAILFHLGGLDLYPKKIPN